jgi:cyanophycin synthetase
MKLKNIKPLHYSFLLFIVLSLLLIYTFYQKYMPKPMIEKMTMKDNLLQTYGKQKGITFYPNERKIQICNSNSCISKTYPRVHFNSIQSHQLAKNKPKTTDLLKLHDIPTPNYLIIDRNSPDKIKPNQYPVVLKPLDGMQGKDVYTDIENEKQFEKIKSELLQKYSQIMLENQIFGENYRIFVFENKVMDIVERVRPYVIGDGVHSIQKLIEWRNEKQKKDKNYPTKYIHENTILKQGYQLDSILPLNQKIFITNTINYHNGANPKRIPLHKIPKENIDLFIKAHQTLGLICSGIDYMSPNISIPYHFNKGTIIEINDMVDTKIHVYADNKKNPGFLYKNIINEMIKSK